MLLKIIAFIAAVIPAILFIRAMLFKQPTKASARLTELKKQMNLAVTIFLVLIACLVLYAAGRLVWTWL